MIVVASIVIGGGICYSEASPKEPVPVQYKLIDTTIIISGSKRKSKKIKIRVYNVYKGDYVKNVTGKKQYKKIIKKDSHKKNYKIKTKKLKKGQKIKVTTFNKFNQVLSKKTVKVK